MLRLLSWLAQLTEFVVACPCWAFRFVITTLVFNPRLGRLRLIVAPAILYVLFALTLTYVYAPIRGLAGQMWMAKVLTYADERSLGTAIYDVKGRFVGIFDPLLDSEEDFNATGHPIELPGYIAYPDHKSLHVGEVPEDYWQCLRYQEDRHLGGLINPFGIDLYGVLKIPVSTVERTFSTGHLGFGGSTLAMQLARIFFKTPPSAHESAAEKLSRKLKEWWLAPVIQWRLTQGGDATAMKRWAANHFPLAQRTGGQELYGVEQTSLVLFGKQAEGLSRAEQYALAAAVNQPVILIAGTPALQARRNASWRRVAGSRAKGCAEALITDSGERRAVEAELDRLAASPPEPRAMPDTEEALAGLTPVSSVRAGANPVFRSNALLPSVKYGVRDELKHRYGFGWRSKVSAVHLTLDAAENLRFREREKDALSILDRRFHDHLNPHYTLSLDGVDTGADANAVPRRVPDVIIAAADERGRLVRYFETNFNAAYFGSAAARDPQTGRYDKAREARAIASIGKIVAAVAIANEGTDRPTSGWLDTRSPATGLEACGHGQERRLRSAQVSFACSLNAPLEWRTAQIPLGKLEHLVDGFGITLTEPVNSAANLAKSLVVGHVAASPRTVHRMAATVLASLAGDASAPVPLPTLLDSLSLSEAGATDAEAAGVVPDRLIKPEARAMLKAFLAAPLCYKHGTLNHLSDWCAERRPGVALHFAKTGTRGTGAVDPEADDTVDLWVAGGIKFASGPAFSYVLVIGSGSPSDPFARDLYAGQVAEPLLRVLLEDLEGTANAPPKQLTEAR
jgi:penicillin-binding protein 1A